MAENSKIEWTTHTFNAWRGCTKISPGCTHCYAETMSKRNPGTLGVWGDKGTRVIAAESYWRQPLKWNAEAAAAWDLWSRESSHAGAPPPERRRVFCASLADVFEDWQGPLTDSQGRRVLRGEWEECLTSGDEPLTLDYFRFELFNLIRRTPHLDWLLLTKRPENVAGMTAEFLGAWELEFMPNVWLGVSVEDQARADERIPLLLQTPAAVRFLSVEPLLGPVDLTEWLCETKIFDLDGEIMRPIDWCIIGGESGHNARPCNLAWIRSLVAQCQAAGVACFVKQLGADPTGADYVDGKMALGTLLLDDRKGGSPEEWAADLRVRQFPKPAKE